MKICRDCKYCKPNTELYEEDAVKYAKCLKTSEVDGVTGATKYEYCSVHRKLPYPDLFGPRGKWFEPIKVEIDISTEQESKGFLEKVVKWFKK